MLRRAVLGGLAFSIVVLTVAGCSAQRPDSQLKAEATRPLYCDGSEECEIKWERAIDFVAQHSGYRFQTMTNEFAQTPGPSGAGKIATTIRKQALGGGRYRIAISVACGNNFVASYLCGGKSRMLRYVAAFKNAVNAPMPSDVARIANLSPGSEGITTTNIGPAPNDTGPAPNPDDNSRNSGLPATIVVH